MALRAFSLFGDVELRTAKLKSGAREVDHQYKSLESKTKSTVRNVNHDLGQIGKVGSLSGLNSAFSTLSNISNTIQGLPVVGSLISGALSTIAGPIKDTAQLGLAFNDLRENATLAFSVILRDGQKAKKLFDDLALFGKQSPLFKTRDLIGYSQLFLPTLGAGNELFDSLKGMAALTASTGRLDKMDSIVTAMKQINDSPFLRAEEMNQQLKDAFVDGWALLAEGLGRSVADVQDMAAKNMISGRGAFQVMIAESLRKYGSLVDLMGDSNTGLDRQLEDEYEQLSGRATVGLHDTMKGGKRRVLSLMKGPQGAALADRISEGTGVLGGNVLGAFDSLLDGSLLGKMEKVGQDAKAGLTKGLDATKTAVGHAGDYVLGFKSGIGANSPATQFIPLGQDAAAGFLIGWDAEMIAAGGPMTLFQGKGSRFAGGQRQAQRRAENERLLQHPAIQAMMDAIGVGEGTFDPKTGQRNWMKWFGNAKFTPSAEHPGLSPVPFFNKKKGKWDRSSAAGGGQFLQGTWAGVEQDIGDLDFNNLHHQGLAFVEKMRDRGMISALLRGDVRTAMRLGKDEWASLPDSPYGQPTVSQSTVIDTFNKRMGLHADGSSPVPVQVVSTADPKGGAHALFPSDFVTQQATALRAVADMVKATNEVSKMIKDPKAREAYENAAQAVKSMEGAKTIEGAEEAIKNMTATIETAAPTIAKLGESAKLTTEKIDANRKLAEVPGSKKANEAEKYLTTSNIAGDFQAGVHSLLASVGTDRLSSLFSQAMLSILQNIQSRAAADLSAIIGNGLFGKEGKGGLLGSIFGSLIGALFGGIGGGTKGKIPSLNIGKTWGTSGSFAGGFASGGKLHPGEWGIVGENGPEPVSVGRDGTFISPNRTLRGISRRSPSNVVNNYFNNTFNLPPARRGNYSQRRSQAEMITRLLQFNLT